KSACEAVQLIIVQGEGEVRGLFGAEGELAHYYRFDQLKQRQYYQPFGYEPPDTPRHPSGRTFSIDWEKVYPVKPNVKIADYPQGSDLGAAALDFNTCYAEFLQFLTRAFNGERELLLEAVTKMFGFRDLMNRLIRNPLPGTPWHAGPTFEIDVPA